jgi:hypothetical protein
MATIDARAVNVGMDGDAAETDAGGIEGGRDGEAPEDMLIVPAGLAVTALSGGNGVLDMIALTLRKGSSGTEIYAALRNDDASIKACDPGLSVELYDKSDQPIGTWIGGLNTTHLYEVPDSGMVASCVGPGEVTMAALTGLPADLVIDDVGTVVYRCPYFVLDVVPVDGVAVGQLATVASDGGTAFAGTLVNDFDAAVISPSVTVFPVNTVGRPLGVASTGGDAGEIAAGGTWPFQTGTVDVPVVGYVAYPTANLLQ